jgi:hypothetical protein
MKEGILGSIADRGGPDVARCILKLLFDNFLNGVTVAPTWRDLWKDCWKKPIDTRRGADVEYSSTVRQAIYRLREMMDRYFESDAGQLWPVRAVIDQNEYRLRLETQPPENNGLSDSPFIDSPFPGSDVEDEEDE